MKKILSITLVLLILGAFAFPGMTACFAVSEELLDNPSFANGIDNWTASRCKLAEENTVSQDGDDSSLFISARECTYASMRYMLTETITQNGSGKYQASAWLRLAKGANATNMALCFSVINNDITTWQTGADTQVTANGWTQLTMQANFTVDTSLSEVKFYFVQPTTDTVFPDVYVDNCSLVKVDAVVTPAPTTAPATAVPASATIKRADKLRIGSIRWDAWMPSTTQVGGEVAKALNPEKYRSRAPFFSILNSKGNLDFPQYTIDIWEKEADYAINAGIDYWAYVWYSTTDPMSAARKFHTQSAKNKQIQMCAILGASTFTATDRNELFAAMKGDYYLKVDGMPLVYVYDGTTSMNKDQVQALRSYAAAAGLPPLYMIAMNSADDKTTLSSGYDALSFYSYGISDGPLTYAQLAAKAESRNALLGAKVYNNKPIQIIPSFTAGRDVRPRIDNPVSWAGDYGKSNYAEVGTAQEVANHMTNVINWTFAHPDNTVANCVISYAWNEHDEGGWICPTIKTDADGKLLYDADGKFVPDTSRIDAIEEAITAFRVNEATGVIPTASSTATATADTTLAPEATAAANVNNVNTILFIAIPAVVLVGIGVLAFVLIKKKKEKTGSAL